MKNSPSAAITAAKILPSPEPARSIALPTGFRRAWTSFWFSAVDPIGLNALRVFAGLLFIAWLLPLGGHLQAFFGMSGWFDREAYIKASQLQEPLPIPLWSLLYWIGNSATVLQIVYWLAIAVFALFALGLWTRITAVLTWVFVVSFLASPAASYGADVLLGILAFYLMVGYLLLGLWSGPQTRSFRLLGWTAPWFSRLLGGQAKEEIEDSHAANLAVRLFQIHFAIIVLGSALHKLQMGDWWRGMAFWYPLHPPFEMTQDILQSEETSINSTLFFLSLGQYLALAWQLAFPFFAWRKGISWRVLLLAGGVLGWLGSFFLFKLPLFGPFYLIGCLGYLTAEEWRGLSQKIGSLIPGLSSTVRVRGANAKG
jgi:hypothetical protein